MTRPVISPDEAPTTLSGAWSLFPLYKQPARGGLRMWQVGFDGIDHLEIHYGVVDGAIQFDRTEVKLNNSKRNMQEQALLEARSRYLKKFREGYEPAKETNSLQDQAIVLGTPTHSEAMKATHYHEGMIKHWPVITQPKLDGIRMIASIENGVVVFRSRGNKFFTSLAHLSNDVAKLLALLPTGSKLDGELYSSQLPFQELCSALKRVKKLHERVTEIEYWIFDVDLPPLLTATSKDPILQPYEERYNILAKVMGYPLIGETTSVKNPYATLRLVPSQLAFSHTEIMQQHDLYVSQGYEAIMVKKTAYNLTPKDPDYAQALYKSGRTQNILKYKEFQDEEVDIIGVQEAKGKQKGAVVFEVQDARGNKFTSSMEGSLAQRREWFQHPELVIGKKLTIRFQELTNKGVPRIAVGVAIRDYE